MSRNLGVPYTDKKPYYFISYNSEDEQVVSKYAKALAEFDFPMWYDNGISKGEKWQKEIADRMQECEAVIMFLSKNIFLKEDSYVHTEYELAIRHFKKEIFIVMIDDVEDSEVPNLYKMWWIQVNKLQCIEAFKHDSVEKCIEEILVIPQIRKNIKKTTEKQQSDVAISTTIKRRSVLSVRDMAKKYHGKKCYVCNIDFEEVYGEGWENLLEIHHIQPLHIIDEEVHEGDIKNIVPLCPNCHSMLHKKVQGKYFSIDELRKIMNKQ